MLIDSVLYYSTRLGGTYLVTWMDSSKKRASATIQSYVNNTLGLGDYICHPSEFPEGAQWVHEHIKVQKIQTEYVDALPFSLDTKIFSEKTFEKKSVIPGYPLTIIEEKIAEDMIGHAEKSVTDSLTGLYQILGSMQWSDDQGLDHIRALRRNLFNRRGEFCKELREGYLSRSWLFCDRSMNDEATHCRKVEDRMDMVLNLIRTMLNNAALDQAFYDKMSDPWA